MVIWKNTRKKDEDKRPVWAKQNKQYKNKGGKSRP